MSSLERLKRVKAPSALLIVPAALLSATLAVAVPSWDIELTDREEPTHTQSLAPVEKQPSSIVSPP